MPRTSPIREKEIRARRKDLCPEALRIIEGHAIEPGTFGALYQMVPARQVEAARIMTVTGNYSSTFARALLVATPTHGLARPNLSKVLANVRRWETAAIESEIRNVKVDFTTADDKYGANVLQLSIARAYLAKLIAHPVMRRHLRGRYPELLASFKAIVAMTSLLESGKPRSRRAD